MIDPAFPPFIADWPEAELEFAGLSGRILKSDWGVVIFMSADRDVVVPLHHHGPQWGLVLAGQMDLVIGAVTRTYRTGESHFIPADVDHEAKLYAGWRGLYIFPRIRPPAHPTGAAQAALQAARSGRLEPR